MSDSKLTSLVLPALYDHFDKPENRNRLKVLAEWDRSFEKWFQWEVAFALYKPLMKLGGQTWSQKRWDAWDIEVQHGAKRVDMAVPFKPRLLLELKVHVPWVFPRKWLRGDGDCLYRDIQWVRRVRNHPAAAILLGFEAHGHPIPLRDLGVPQPIDPDPRGIALGKACCAGAGKHKPLQVTARLYAWANAMAVQR